MKIEGIIYNRDLTIEAIRIEIGERFPNVKFSREQMKVLTDYEFLRRAKKLLREEVGDSISNTAADAFSDRAGELEQDGNYLSALQLMGRKSGGMSK